MLSTLRQMTRRILIALGRAYDSLGRYPEAEWMFGRALAWDPRSVVVQKSYAAHLDFWKRGARGGRPAIEAAAAG